MRTIYDTRRDNLRALIGQWGGPTSLSKKLGHANGSYIAQLARPRPPAGARKPHRRVGFFVAGVLACATVKAHLNHFH